MPAPVIRELTADLLSDWLAYFDHEAFADHPEWSGCYCHFFHADHTEKDWDTRTAEENRAASSALILSGRLKGHLAYLDGKTVGWCHAAPRRLIPNIANDPALVVNDAGDVGSIPCFVVARASRGLGVARRLLDAACAGFRAQGAANRGSLPAPAGPGRCSQLPWSLGPLPQPGLLAPSRAGEDRGRQAGSDVPAPWPVASALDASLREGDGSLPLSVRREADAVSFLSDRIADAPTLLPA